MQDRILGNPLTPYYIDWNTREGCPNVQQGSNKPCGSEDPGWGGDAIHLCPKHFTAIWNITMWAGPFEELMAGMRFPISPDHEEFGIHLIG